LVVAFFFWGVGVGGGERRVRGGRVVAEKMIEGSRAHRCALFFSLAPFRSRSSRFEPGDIVSASNARAGRERKLVHGPTESSRAHSKKKLAASSSFDGRRKLALACSLVPSRPSLVLARSPASVPKQPPFLDLLTQSKTPDTHVQSLRTTPSSRSQRGPLLLLFSSLW
jgi:hypothetical protein